MHKKEKPVKEKKQNDFLFLRKHIDFAWGYVFLAAAVSIVQSIVVSFVPDAMASLFDGDFNPAKLWNVVQTILLTLVLSLIATLFRVFAESKSVLAARNSVWEQMLRAKTSYYDQHDANSLLTMVTVDAQTMGAGLVQLIVFVATMATLVLACALQLFGYNPKLLLVLLIIIPVHVVYLFFIGRWQKKIGKKLTETIGGLTGYLAERIRNLPMIKSFAAEDQEYANGVAATRKLYKVGLEYNGYLATVTNTYMVLSGVVGAVLPVICGVSLLRSGEIDQPTFIAFTGYVTTISVVLSQLSVIYGFVQDFAGRAHRIARLVEFEKEAPVSVKQKKKVRKAARKAAAAAVPMPSGDLQIQNVAFRYKEDGAYALESMNLTIPAGKVTAIVGPSGSGKTTLVKLIERLYEPTEGSISKGDTDISSLDLMAWRRTLSYVVQDAGVFSGTLREAITYGERTDITDEEIIDVTRQVGIYDFITGLPQGFDTDLAGWGASLSGGQRQRIVIARALLQRADTYIFDEPTSALDADSAALIQKLIMENFQSKTVIIISHELAFIAQADQIVYIHDGRLEGAGKHDELMDTCNGYRRLVEQQSYQEVFGA